MSQSISKTRFILGLMGILTLSLVGFKNIKTLEPYKGDLYVPSIGVVLQGKTFDFFGDEEGCEYVGYQVYVRNTSDNGEVFEDIIITNSADPLFTVDMGSLKGDDNLNGFLDPGETWEYLAYRPIDESLFPLGQIHSQVTASANIVGQPLQVYTDDSHPSSFADGSENQTVIPIPCISGVNVITTEHKTMDTGGQEGGCAAIEYTIEVTHDGNPADSFSIHWLRDENGNTISNLVSGDEGISSVLEPGETWVYKVTRPITHDQIIAGQAEAQFHFQIELNGSSPTVWAMDLSDHTSPDEDRPTVTDLSHCVPKIALIKEAALNANCTEIDYTFIVTNEGVKDLTNVLVSDKNNPAMVITGPSGDTGNDGVLALDEVWQYTATYVIPETELENEEITNIASVQGDVVEFPTLTIADESHPTEKTLDGPTITDLTSCAPGIGITKTGAIDTDCLNIDYTFVITNQGNKALENVVVAEIDIPGLIINGPNGDLDLDGELDLVEVWTYTATYAIQQSDLNTGSVSNSAQVDANVAGNPAQTVTDLSHPDDVALNAPTVIDISSCVPGISIIKTGAVDTNCTSIEYTFEVTNMGSLNLENIVVTDNDIPGLVINGPSGDDDMNGQLNGTETWSYTATYILQQNDLNNGQVQNQAQVEANVVGNPAQTVTDQSHPDDVGLNAPTVTDVSACVPNISILKTGTVSADCLTIGYAFTVANQGNQDLEAVAVTDIDNMGLVINGPTDDVGLDGILSVGESWSYNATYAIQQGDFNAGSVSNTAQVDAHVLGLPAVTISDQSHPDDPTLDAPTITDVSPCVPNISILKTGTVSADCLSIDYSFTVANQGNLDLTVDEVKDNDLPALVINGPTDDVGLDGILSVGESWSYNATYAIQQTDFDDGEVQNQAEVNAHVVGQPALTVTDLSDDDSVFENDKTITNLSGCIPNISLIKTGTVSADCLSIGYNFTVENQGNQPLDNVVVSDPLLTVPALPDSGDIDNDGLLDPNETWIFTANYPITATDLNNGQVQNQAQVDANVAGDALTVSDDSHPTDTSMDGPTVTDISSCVPKISLVKESIIGSCAQIGYFFTVRNESTSHTFSNILIQDLNLPLTIVGPTEDANNDNLLSPNETWLFTSTYVIQQSDFDNGSITNTASVNANVLGFQDFTITDFSHPSDTTLDAPTITDFSVCQDPKIGLIKEATLEDLDQDGCNESVFYRFTVANTGNVSLSNLVLEDQLLFNGTVAGPINGSDDGNDGILSPNETWIYEAYYGITDQDLANGDVVNQATVTGWTQNNDQVTDVSDDNSFDEDDATLILVGGSCEVAAPGIGLIKLGYLSDTDEDECPEAIDYTFYVSNRGGEPLANVTLSDSFLGTGTNISMVSGDSNSNGLLDLGEEWEYSASYTLTSADIEAGKVENQAEVTALSTITQQTVMDLSDNNSYEENDPTSTEVIDACDPEGPDPNPINENFEIYTGITPNGDGINDFFRINGIENYPDNVLKIFNRWGVLVYEAEGYGIGNKLFSGISEGRATVSQQETLPSGTYFYTLKFENLNPGQETYSGYLYINRD